MARAKKPRKPKKVKPPKIDGLGPDNLKLIHKAVRQVWQWSHAWRLARARATDARGFFKCEKCKKRVPKIFVDHLDPVGKVGGAHYIEKMFCPSARLQTICKKCHDPKTKAEQRDNRAAAALAKKGFM